MNSLDDLLKAAAQVFGGDLFDGLLAEQEERKQVIETVAQQDAARLGKPVELVRQRYLRLSEQIATREMFEKMMNSTNVRDRWQCANTLEEALQGELEITVAPDDELPPIRRRTKRGQR